MVFPRTKFLLDISYGRWWWSIDWFLSFIIPAGYLHSSFFPFIFYFLLLSGPSLESVNSSPFPVKSPLLVPTQETFVQSPLGYTWCLFPLTYWKYLTIWIYIFLLSPLGAGFLEMIESILLISAVVLGILCQSLCTCKPVVPFSNMTLVIMGCMLITTPMLCAPWSKYQTFAFMLVMGCLLYSCQIYGWVGMFPPLYCTCSGLVICHVVLSIGA